jgi:hypothetical protein
VATPAVTADERKTIETGPSEKEIVNWFIGNWDQAAVPDRLFNQGAPN